MTKLKHIWPFGVITFGCLLAAFGYVLFILPMNLFEGGVIGIGIIIKSLTGLPIVGLVSLSLTSVFFVIGLKLIGKSFGVKSIYATILLSVLIDGLSMLNFAKLTDDILLAAFYGGALVGVGMGMVYYYGASTGGADALAQILKRLKKIPIGRTLIIVDFIVLSTAALLINLDNILENIMYSFVFIFVQIKAVDFIINGFKASQQLSIISDNPDKIRETILFKLERGLTIYEGTGGYSGKKRNILTTVIPKKDVPELRRAVAAADPDAFVVIHDVDMVYGEGFESLK